MKLKPSLDVENIADFKQYYEHSYVRLRNSEEVVRIDLVRPTTEQIAYTPCWRRDSQAPKMALIDWGMLPHVFLFGKVPSGMCDVLGRLAWRYQTNNRTGSRGYHPEEYRTQYLGAVHDDLEVGEANGWDKRMWEDVIADQAFNPRYTPITTINPENTRRSYALTHLYGIVPRQTVVPTGYKCEWSIFRRDVRVGEYDPVKKCAYFGQEAYKKYAIPFSLKMGVPVHVKIAE